MNKLLAATLAGGVFAAGMLAPESWRTTVQKQVGQVTGKPVADKSKTAPAGASKKGSDAPVFAYAQVQRPLQLAKGDTLGLGLGLYTGTQGGSVVQKKLTDLGFKTRYLAVKDDNGQVWRMLIAGEYQNETEAERHLAILADSLGGGVTPRIVRIPPPPKKK